MKRAFTLIELLVVIAIIAILAAILFPVFTQAKTQAKGAASISNAKQIGIAWIMYADSQDDTAACLATSAPGPLNFNGLPYSPWGVGIQPFMKNSAVLQDPLTKSNPIENGIPTNLLWPYRPQYGYAYTVWSPLTAVTTDGSPTPQKLTAAANPADTIAFTARKDRLTLDWTFTGTIIWMAQAIAPPYCGGGSSITANTNVNPQSMCAISYRWGTDGSAGLSPGPTDREGRRTGMVALRYFEKTVALYGDGHAKAVTHGNLAAGTNWNWNSTSTQIQMTDITKYQWDHD
ncbi:MAG: prepilin-type N-terminal cleavage/methylation domain-containing protein [Chthonomonas sp.]|nr:prepilin-type N-terminal cleavage/methylation domain-containing protein [Chthonomonas sp.]